MIGDVLLDTTVVVAHLRGVASVSERLEQAQLCYLSTVALGELHFGLWRSTRREENRRQLDRWLQVMALLAVDASTAHHCGQLKQRLLQAGTPIPENDLWIAACASQHGLPLATRDAHFIQVPGLSVLDWR